MKPFTVRIDECPREVLEAFSDEELLLELMLRDKDSWTFNPTPVKYEYFEPGREFIIGVGKDHSVQLFVHLDTIEKLKEIACLN